MQCPKCKELLTNSQLFGSLKADACATCAGQWVDGDEYQQWRQVQNRATVDPMKVLRANLTAYKVPAETDTKTGLCPQCQRILSRTRVSTEPFFYLEQCLSCNGIGLTKTKPQFCNSSSSTTKLKFCLLVAGKVKFDRRRCYSAKKKQ
jgi:Zn-finger nucleic acid-binding protein